MSNLQPGYELGKGRYIFKKKLGEGGFGVTFLADDTRNGRLVVIKTLNEKMRSDKDSPYFRDKFNNEAVKLGQCDHPHIVKLMDEIIYDDLKFPYLVMEYIPGKNLLQYTKDCSFLPQEEALLYIQQIASALKVVHTKNLYHLDVNPRNIMIREIGKNKYEAVLIDFGTSRRADADLQSVINQFLSHSYAPIERYRQGKQGAYTDVYGLSATLYFMLTGKDPEQAKPREGFIRNGRRDPLISPDVYQNTIDENVSNVILWGMAFEPEDRPQSIEEWLDKLLIQPDKQEVEMDAYVAPKPKKVWLNSAITGLVYGLMTSPLQSIVAKTDTVFILVCWLLPLIGLIFVQYRGTVNFFNGKLIAFLFLVAAAIAISFLLNQPSDSKLLVTILIVFSSMLWSCLWTGIFVSLFPKQMYVKQ